MPELNWVGKAKVITHHMDVPFRVLDRQYSFDEAGQHEADNDSPNMIIHGDNLEALKALLPQYEGRVDCIYIDPPYNTGNEGWIYNDNVNDPRIKKWLGDVVGKEGEDLSRHDKWLCMMYPRLRLLQRLLAPTGAIFISIDDNEVANLRLVCDEIFGGRNHLTTFIWESSGNTDNQAAVIGTHEYVLSYAKNKSLSRINAIVDPNIPDDSKIRRDFVENSAVKNGSKNPPSVVTLPAGFPCSVNVLDLEAHDFSDEFMEESAQAGFIERQMSKRYPVNYPLRLDSLHVRDGRLTEPCRVFTGWMNANKLTDFIANGCRPVESDDESFHFYVTHTGAVYYRKEGRKSHYVQSVLRNMGTTETNKYLLEAMGLNFDYPKPMELVQYLVSLYCPVNGIVLDSFAGSGTTGQGVLQLNQEDSGTRKFIAVELGNYADTLTAGRIKKVISGYENKAKMTPGIAGSFSFYQLGEPLLVDGNLNASVPVEQVREYIWFTETQTSLSSSAIVEQPFYLGTHRHTAYHLLYEPDEATNLGRQYVASLTPNVTSDALVVYADTCTLSVQELSALNVTFKKIPRDITRL